MTDARRACTRGRRGAARLRRARMRKRKEDRMMRILCLSCLKLWPGDRVAERVSCPHCGGTLEQGVSR